MKPGLEVLDVRDLAEYDAIGIPREIASVFVDAEPHFAINTKVPAQQAGVRPLQSSPLHCHGSKMRLTQRRKMTTSQIGSEDWMTT